MRIGARDVRDGVDGAVFFQRVHRADEQRTRQPSERVFGDDAARRGGGAATRARALAPAGRGVGCFIVVGRARVSCSGGFSSRTLAWRAGTCIGACRYACGNPLAASRCASDGVRATLAYLSEHRRGVLGRARLDGNVVRAWVRGRGELAGDAHARMVETTGRGGRRGGSCGGADLDLGIRRRTAVRARGASAERPRGGDQALAGASQGSPRTHARVV